MWNSPTPPPGSRVLIMARYSSNLQNPLSAQDQIDVGVRDAASFGWEVVGIFKDEAKSGRSVASRTGYLDMMAAAEAGLADVIWVFNLDRLGRNARELHDARNRLGDVDVAIYTHDRGVMSRMEFSIWAEMAQMESEKMADRTSRGAKAAAMRGQFMGDVPYGYRLVREEGAGTGSNHQKSESRLETDPVTRAVALRVNLDYDAGLSPNQIARNLTLEGILTPEGKRVWHPNTILGIKGSLNGLLRNPIYVGRVIYGKRKTYRDPKTGRVKKVKADAAEWIEYDAPWLRIVPDDVWQRNQDRIEGRSWEMPGRNRRPDYLLSGLTKCGVCGQPYALVAKRLGCTGRRMHLCNNGRRVAREDVERAVLDGLTDRIAQPHIMEWIIPEYVREAEAAAAEGDDRYERCQRRLAEVVREIDNLVAQVKVGAQGYAAQILNENLDALGAEKERLERDMRARSSRRPTAITTETVQQRVRALLSDLGDALEGGERDATRARDIIRSFIQQITITPVDHNGRQDGRGSGPVRVVVDGTIRGLVDHAVLDRVILHGPGAGDMQDPPIAKFRFYIDITREMSGGRNEVWADMAILAQLLDDAEYPVLRETIIDALNDRNRPPTSEEATMDERRARLAIGQMQRDDWIRRVQLNAKNVGWVWNDRTYSDDEWRARFNRRSEFHPPIGVVRIGVPEAHVVTVAGGAPLLGS